MDFLAAVSRGVFPSPSVSAVARMAFAVTAGLLGSLPAVAAALVPIDTSISSLTVVRTMSSLTALRTAQGITPVRTVEVK